MSVTQSCDHHGPDGLIPDTRSRARMLEQLRAAQALADALELWFRHAVPDSAVGVAAGRLTITLDLLDLAPTLDQLAAWRRVAPAGDDWHPPYDPPAEIRVPPMDDDVETERE
jgi:hypothetical protein